MTIFKGGRLSRTGKRTGLGRSFVRLVDYLLPPAGWQKLLLEMAASDRAHGLIARCRVHTWAFVTTTFLLSMSIAVTQGRKYIRFRPTPTARSGALGALLPRCCPGLFSGKGSLTLIPITALFCLAYVVPRDGIEPPTP